MHVPFVPIGPLAALVVIVLPKLDKGIDSWRFSSVGAESPPFVRDAFPPIVLITESRFTSVPLA